LLPCRFGERFASAAISNWQLANADVAELAIRNSGRESDRSFENEALVNC
jgi:hypothetical protein